ncbi:MAG: SDR family oxidoreductase [Flavobacteriales bacterium]|nr:SDR family oxidoreductase [Flavobacteriales bacterium]
MEKILITGSNGLLGQKLVYKLLKEKTHEIVASARGENRLKVKEGYKYISLDVTSQEEVDYVISSEKPDMIIHTAAMTNVDTCEVEMEAADLLNVRAVEFIVESCKKNNVFLVHLSTDFIFDGKDGPYKENAVANPLSFYGMTKLKAEEIILKSKVKAAILRTVLVFGIVDDMSRSNIVLWAKGAFEKGSPLNVVDDQYRTPTLAEDLADGCVLAANEKIKGVFNISGKDFMSIYELVERVGKFWNLDTSNMSRVSSETLNQAAKRPAITGFDLTKSMGILGYNPHSFEEGLEIVKKQIE